MVVSDVRRIELENIPILSRNIVTEKILWRGLNPLGATLVPSFDNFNIIKMSSKEGLSSTNGHREKAQAHRLYRSYEDAVDATLMDMSQF